MSDIGNMKKKLDQAEKNARKRDRKSEIDLDSVNEVARLADEKGFQLYRTKALNRANFIQTIEDNWDVMIKRNLLSNSELSFLMAIQPLIEFNANAITDRESSKFMTVTQISKYLHIHRTTVSRAISSLLEKGVLFEFADIHEYKKYKRKVTSRALFVNPELFYAGDRNKIDATLALLVSQNDTLERDKILLPWKVWKAPNKQYGKLYSRKTYLKFKNG